MGIIPSIQLPPLHMLKGSFVVGSTLTIEQAELFLPPRVEMTGLSFLVMGEWNDFLVHKRWKLNEKWLNPLLAVAQRAGVADPKVQWHQEPGMFFVSWALIVSAAFGGIYTVVSLHEEVVSKLLFSMLISGVNTGAWVLVAVGLQFVYKKMDRTAPTSLLSSVLGMISVGTIFSITHLWMGENWLAPGLAFIIGAVLIAALKTIQTYLGWEEK